MRFDADERPNHAGEKWRMKEESWRREQQDVAHVKSRATPRTEPSRSVCTSMPVYSASWSR